MSFTDLVLNTKFYVPPSSSSLVARPGVLKKLEQGLTHAVTLVSAPAGFGKTTLLCEWFASEAGKLNPFAWLSLDPEDNDTARFLLYLAVSLDVLQQGISDSVLPLFQMNQLPASDIVLTSLINKLTETLQTPFILVLDDYHVITSPTVHEALVFFIENRPPQIRLVILTREDPPLPLARLRARQQLTEIRAVDLRFSLEDSSVFLNQVMKLGLASQEIEALETRTEGWIAGLQMAAISMLGRDDKSSFIRTFASSNRFIFDYLIEEVLEGQPPKIQDFLLQTSILERMNAPLCDVVTGKDDSQKILTQLEQMNLFVIPLDDQRRWYRYHHLFVNLLRQQLKLEHRTNFLELHQRACKWYQDNDLIGDAIHHALLIENYEVVADLAERLVFESIERHELVTISSWLENLPRVVLQRKPWLSVAFAWILFRTRQFDRVELHLQDVEHSLELQEQNAHIQSHITAIKAYLAGIHGDIEQVTMMARNSLNLLPKKEKRLRGLMFSLLGSSLQRMGNFEEARQSYIDGIASSKAAGDWQNTIESYGDLTGFFVERGQLHEAYSTCQEAFDYVESSFKKGGRNPVGASYIHFRISTILRHWNDLDASLWHAKKSIEIIQQWGSNFRLAYVNLAIALQAVGLHEDAIQAIQKAETIASNESEFWVADVRSVRALLWLDQGNMDAASRWARESGLSTDDEIQFSQQRLYLTLAQVLLAQGQHGDAEALAKTLQLLSRLQVLLDASNAQAYLLQILNFQALAYQAQGRMEQALSSISHAIAMGEPGGYIRVFVREGEPMRKILEEAVKNNLYLIYTQKLLSTFDIAPEKNIVDMSKLEHDRLTTREREVLELLDTDLTIPEIAAQLVISVSTARTHTKRIYSKLDVHSRFEAVTKAKQKN